MATALPGISRATQAINENEPCLELAEVNRVVPLAGAGLHRFQIVKVVRNDQVYEWVKDMGRASKFKTDQFIFPGAVALGNGRYDVLETVGRLRGAADEFRAKYDQPYQPREAPRDLRKGFEEFATRRRDAKKGRVRFALGGA